MTGKELIKIIQKNNLEELEICQANNDKISFDAGTTEDTYHDKVLDIFDETVKDKFY